VSVDDVWRRIDKHLGVYLDGTFDQIPESAGVYGWFYPLRVTTKDLRELISELSKVSDYDALCESKPQSTNNLDFNWITSKVTIKQSLKLKSIPQKVFDAWELYKDDEDLFNQLRKSLMSASLLMPPLYIGKTNNLRTRCMQHVKGTDQDVSDFHQRFETFAKSENFSSQEIQNLIFVCVKTEYDKTDKSMDNTFLNPHSVVEEILKAVAKPPYGKI